MLCVNSYYIDQHLSEIDREESFVERINKRVAELTVKGGEFYPFSRDGVMEALGSLNESQELILQHSLESGLNEIGLMISNWVESYWILQAEKKAMQEIGS